MSTRIQMRGDTAANWTAANPVLLAREPGIETDTGLTKYGDGTTAWNALPYTQALNTNTVIYDTTNGVWPARPSSSGSVHWIDPRLVGATAPPNGSLRPGDLVTLAS